MAGISTSAVPAVIGATGATKPRRMNDEAPMIDQVKEDGFA
jgi:hypothetical protein